MRNGTQVAVDKRVFTPNTIGWSTVVELRPLEPLRPDTTYDIVDQRVAPCDEFQTLCRLTPAVAFATFTTGSKVDNTPPVFAGIGAANAEGLDICANDGCCGPHVSRRFSIGWGVAVDDFNGEDVVYTIYGSARDPVWYFPGTSLMGSVTCQSSPLASFRPPGVLLGPGPYHVSAVDWAGNEDRNAVTKGVVADCPPPSADAAADAFRAPPPDARGTGAADAGVDAEVEADASAEPPAHKPKPRTGGCAAGGREAPRGALLILAGVAILARRRSNRRQEPRPGGGSSNTASTTRPQAAPCCLRPSRTTRSPTTQ
jgi:hypothetical protein